METQVNVFGFAWWLNFETIDTYLYLVNITSPSYRINTPSWILRRIYIFSLAPIFQQETRCIRLPTDINTINIGKAFLLAVL